MEVEKYKVETKVTVISDEEISIKKSLIESVFKRIYKENMRDIPVNNDKLEVTVIGLQQWQEYYLGIVITPWFMNIFLTPYENELWDDLAELSKQTFIFPSGRYSFITGRDKELGTYQMCSLFSPMFEFADNEAAIDTATVAIRELMNVENIEQTDIDSEQIEKIWQGEEPLPENIEDQFTDFAEKDEEKETNKNNAKNLKEDNAETKTPLKNIQQNIQQPISRRDMLRGRFLRETKDHD
ncbi:MAG: [NiFe]-hydrogenase assembly chaperone HybE [Proteobacteria bacterium]|nr:[NiFe]-hydrogenase assembly chaperone HybE [Pseudomonadota bacterium]